MIRLLVGDVRARLGQLAPESVHMVVTSPPYYGLRAYGTQPQEWPGGWVGELGNEPSIEQHVANMVEVFRAVYRVLRRDGTLWLNYGDSYAAPRNGRSAADTKAAGGDDRTFRDKPTSTVSAPAPKFNADGSRGIAWRTDRRHGTDEIRPNGGSPGRNHPLKAASPSPQHQDYRGLPDGEGNRRPLIGVKAKDLIGMPWRVALALQADGWYLRKDIIWHKPNPMPESIRDRPTTAHEHLFLFAKHQRYYYDAISLMQRASPDTNPRVARRRKANPKNADGGPGSQTIAKEAPSAGLALPANWNHGPGGHGNQRKMAAPGSGIRANHAFEAGISAEVVTWVNVRDVWSIATEPFRGAHFATFPTELVRRCIVAGSSSMGVCASCGAPWRRNRPKRKAAAGRQSGNKARRFGEDHIAGASHVGRGFPWTPETAEVAGWVPGCRCASTQARVVARAVVLDPFGGSGTVGKVAIDLNRDAVLIELQADYARMAHQRIGLMTEVEHA